MLYNYLKVALRHIMRSRLYSLVNIVGLTAGLTCTLLIFLWVRYELSYDQFHKNVDLIYRVAMEYSDPSGSKILGPMTPYRLKPSFETDFPIIKSIVRLDPFNNFLMAYGDRQFHETQIAFADTDFFNVFSFPLTQGSPDSVLKDPFTMVIDEDIAAKYFGDENPIGKSVTLDGEHLFKITGVMKKMPENAHFHHNIILSMETGKTLYSGIVLNNWGEISQSTYLLLNSQKDGDILKKQFPGWIDKTFKEVENASSKFKIVLQPLKDIHLKSHGRGEIEPGGSLTHVILFTMIAFFILVIAGVNYMNLATARSARRSMEVGLRKVMGSQKLALIGQFLSESILTTFLSMCLALGAAEVALPWFNKLASSKLTLFSTENLDVLIFFIVISLILGVLAGSWPAFFLSSFRPLTVLKGSNSHTGTFQSLLRKGLVVFQFTASIILIIGTIIVFQQTHFLQNRNLGYNRDNVVIVQKPDSYLSFKHELLSNPSILNVTVSNKKLTRRLSSNLGFKAEGVEPGKNRSIKILTVDQDFFKTFNIPIVKGRDFTHDILSDATESFILNEAAVKMLGWDHPIGKWFETSTLNEKSEWIPRKGKIIGVAKDFNFESLHETIKPVVYFVDPNWIYWSSIRISGNNMSDTLASIETIWKKYAPDYPFMYSFLDSDIDALYASEQQFLKIFSVFTVLALIITSLGILGLAAFTAEQRTREMGIRKVLGASVSHIVGMIIKDFSWLVAVANLIGWPVAWWMMNSWLKEFPLRVSLSPFIFILTGCFVMLISMIIVAFQALKAARANPAITLKWE